MVEEDDVTWRDPSALPAAFLGGPQCRDPSQQCSPEYLAGAGAASKHGNSSPGSLSPFPCPLLGLYPPSRAGQKVISAL